MSLVGLFHVISPAFSISMQVMIYQPLQIKNNTEQGQIWRLFAPHNLGDGGFLVCRWLCGIVQFFQRGLSIIRYKMVIFVPDLEKRWFFRETLVA